MESRYIFLNELQNFWPQLSENPGTLKSSSGGWEPEKPAHFILSIRGVEEEVPGVNKYS